MCIESMMNMSGRIYYKREICLEGYCHPPLPPDFFVSRNAPAAFFLLSLPSSVLLGCIYDYFKDSTVSRVCFFRHKNESF